MDLNKQKEDFVSDLFRAGKKAGVAGISMEEDASICEASAVATAEVLMPLIRRDQESGRKSREGGGNSKSGMSPFFLFCGDADQGELLGVEIARDEAIDLVEI